MTVHLVTGHAGKIHVTSAEQAQYNALYAELAVWLRQNYPPRSRAQWRW